MGKKIYGIDLDGEITPIMVRDAINGCFFKAHCEDTGISGKDDEKEYCTEIVKKAFEETKGDYKKPTKESILNVVLYLVEFSKRFRNPDIIKKHQAEIEELINKL